MPTERSETKLCSCFFSVEYCHCAENMLKFMNLCLRAQRSNYDWSDVMQERQQKQWSNMYVHDRWSQLIHGETCRRKSSYICLQPLNWINIKKFHHLFLPEFASKERRRHNFYSSFTLLMGSLFVIICKKDIKNQPVKLVFLPQQNIKLTKLHVQTLTYN